jgi:hypothetical protein
MAAARGRVSPDRILPEIPPEQWTRDGGVARRLWSGAASLVGQALARVGHRRRARIRVPPVSEDWLVVHQNDSPKHEGEL